MRFAFIAVNCYCDGESIFLVSIGHRTLTRVRSYAHDTVQHTSAHTFMYTNPHMTTSLPPWAQLCNA